MSGVVYAMRSATGEALYIGASMHAARIDQHQDKSWWPEVACVEVEHFPMREDAHAAEQEILAIAPGRFNRRLNERIVSEEELAQRREARQRRNEEAARRAAEKRREFEDSTYYVPGLRCHNCSWAAGRVTKGKTLRECRACPICGCDSLTVNGVPVAEVSRAVAV